MSRGGYSDECEGWDYIRYRGAVLSGIRGARGQQLLRELLGALDAMLEKELIASDLERDGSVCALGAVGRARAIDMSEIEPDDYHAISKEFNIADSMAREIMYINDEWWSDDAKRWAGIREWAAKNIQPKKG